MTFEKRQLELGNSLRELRTAAGFVTGKDFAERIGWLASKVSRIENGRTLLSDADLTTWCLAVAAPAKVTAELRDSLLGVRLERDRWKRQLRQGHTARQRAEAVSEQAASHITMVEFFVVPGLVQTPDYARAVFDLAAELHESPSDTGDAVRARIRRQEVLYDTGKTIEILVGESALRYPICPQPVLRAQLDRLTNLAGLPHLRFGVVPLDVPLPTVTMHGYGILDDTVTVEINHTEITVSDPEDVDLYHRITERLWDTAVEGAAATALVRGLLNG
ncbi:Helix-turn-helix domain-containing protein [Amycolatopsis xylanica]|uniref:Helix-turn-helix domain-containing protein n=1 Tax=Amycolatopsis xylanica TaxID=589385 RepID=A0A1H3HDU5_9PSEU|nr:helix-turn-helix transcriptional regulator [Amycolatopsis xylanica]SDY12819.1 Helix-turn-helix domain-containing protein [Amycolatopsis xylanica]